MAKQSNAIIGACLWAGIGVAAQTAQPLPGPGGGADGWHVVARQHVTDAAEKDLAFVQDSAPLAAVRVCAEGRAVRVRNAILWLPGHQRQRLWLPLVLDAGQCSDPTAIDGGPQRVTHIAFEYEAFDLGPGGAHIVVTARRGVAATPR